MWRRLKTFDPGWVRLEQAIKSGLAMATAMLLMLAVMRALSPALEIAPVMFALIVAFISYMAVNEVKPHERKRTLLLSSLCYIVGPFVAGFLHAWLPVVAILLLVLMFLSFYVRRYGVRAAELGLSTLFAYYFSLLFGATLDLAPWFAVAAVAGVASTFFWQFVVRPYDPARFLRQGIAALDAAVIDTVDAITRRLASPAAPDATAPNDTGALLKRVRAARQVSEVQLVGLADAPGWNQATVRQLRTYLFDMEQSLKALAVCADGCAQRRSQVPEPLQALADQTLAALRATLLESEPAKSLDTLKATISHLAEQAHATLDNRAGVVAFAGLGRAAVKLAQSVQAVKILLAQAQVAPVVAEEVAKEGTTPAHKPAQPAMMPAAAGNKLHPTTALGIQAVVACGLAMSVAALFNLERPYWAFWTAFIVVAGPAGESLQKLIYRVVGVTLGSLFGTLLAVLAPDNFLFMVALQILAMMLALYTRVINYAWMCFWITTFVGLLYSVEGEPLQTVLIVRPLDTLIGATIAALVVLFVLPIHAQSKFRAMLAGLLKTTDAYLQTIAGSLGQPDAQAAVGAAALQAASAFEAAAKTFPAMLLESSPFLHAQRGAEQTAIVRELYREVESFAAAVENDTPEMPAEEVALIRDMTATIHANIDALEHIAGGQPVALQPLHWSEPPAADAASPPEYRSGALPLGMSAVIALGRINHTLLQLGDQFRPAVVESPN